MLVEINLLPKKEAKPIGLLLILFGFFILILLAVMFFYMKGISYTNEIQSLQNEINLTQKSSALEQKKATVIESSSSVEQLKKSIEWAESYPIKTIPLMRKLTALLPERGFIQSFAYDETGTIKISVQFDSESEAAFFLSRLDESKWIDSARMTKLAAQTINGPVTPDGSQSSTSYLPRYIGDFDLKVNKVTSK
ncbi:MAG: hypothetical protein Q8906_16515, partial [Bacillota bacterium]|nr:hypothetical protein [Bacillota bacterium]